LAGCRGTLDMVPQEIARAVGNQRCFHDLPFLTDLECEAVAAQLGCV
jgi:hypothetical protein